MRSKNFTYEKSGVSIKKADKFIKFISSSTKKSKKSVNFKNIGGFGAITKLPSKLKKPFPLYQVFQKPLLCQHNQ